jgi:ribonuclease P protein component
MKPHSLPKNYLIIKKREYNKVYDQGKRLHGENFSLILLPNNKLHNRLGISIHGLLKGSANRNRIKRVIKEFFRLNKGFLQDEETEGCELPAMDIVFTVRKGFHVENPAALAETVANLIERKRQSLLKN